MAWRRSCRWPLLALAALSAADAGACGGAGSLQPADAGREAGAVDMGRERITGTINLCGDGRLDQRETCDDFNRLDGDGCSASCALEPGAICERPGWPCGTCGDGELRRGEACEDGNARDGDGCSANCRRVEPGWRCQLPGKRCAPICGDRLIVGAEQCDDGNAAPGDGCSSTCLIEGGDLRCGDGVVSGAESCDDGAANGGAVGYGSCALDCRFDGFCGDGVVEGPEACDLGELNSPTLYGPSGCTVACQAVAYCGDAIVDAEFSEECDLGAATGQPGTLCTSECYIPRI